MNFCQGYMKNWNCWTPEHGGLVSFSRQWQCIWWRATVWLYIHAAISQVKKLRLGTMSKVIRCVGFRNLTSWLWSLTLPDCASWPLIFIPCPAWQEKMFILGSTGGFLGLFCCALSPCRVKRVIGLLRPCLALTLCMWCAQCTEPSHPSSVCSPPPPCCPSSPPPSSALQCIFCPLLLGFPQKTVAAPFGGSPLAFPPR